jgi:hypothetical protein
MKQQINTTPSRKWRANLYGIKYLLNEDLTAVNYGDEWYSVFGEDGYLRATVDGAIVDFEQEAFPAATSTEPEQESEAEHNSLKYVMQRFSEILEFEKQMKAEEGNDMYYTFQKRLNEKLVEFLRLNFTYLNTRQLLKLCALVSTHRPVQPFSFLVTCSNLIND